jgi:hypothetical protein
MNCKDLLESTLLEYEQDFSMADRKPENLVEYITSYLPTEIISELETVFDEPDFIIIIFEDRYHSQQGEIEKWEPTRGLCEICERNAPHMTRHHLFPREMHKRMIKKGMKQEEMNVTIRICRMCHCSIHKFFTNEELCEKYNTVTALMSDDRFYRYAAFAGNTTFTNPECLFF